MHEKNQHAQTETMTKAVLFLGKTHGTRGFSKKVVKLKIDDSQICLRQLILASLALLPVSVLTSHCHA